MAKPEHFDGLLATLDRLKGTAVGIVGDLVADIYISGLTDRVSREAPVLIIQYEEEWIRPGGAANVAANVAGLGATACVVGVVGEDEPGQRLLSSMRDAVAGITHCDQVIVAPGRSTITKTRFLAGAKLTSRQQVLRLDRQPPAAPEDGLLARLADNVRRLDDQVQAWIISDYGYGGCDGPLRELLREIAARKPVIVDSRYNLHRFTGMTVVKPNEEEAQAAAHALGLQAGSPGALAGSLAGALKAGAALVTLGNQGMVLGRSEDVLHIPAVGTEEIVDLTGAGDAVAATLGAALAAQADIQTAARLSNHAGAIVVMKEGAATASPDELRTSVRTRELSA